jgi:dienelactone hydrolase
MLMAVLLVLGSGCSSIAMRHENAGDIASSSGLSLHRIQAGHFLLTTYQKGLKSAENHITVYIEGDGNAWDSRYRLSTDPTPKNPLSLKLAAKDSAEAILYIARPCMYLPDELIKTCEPKYWSSHRYAQEVIAAINQAINIATRQRDDLHLTLVGYSGGGAVAALVAARRNDVASLITLSANLDHKTWTDIQSISPLSGSLNPIDYADQLRHIEQIHFLGEKDRIVQRSVIQSYLSRLGPDAPAELRMIEGFDHACCWEEVWPGLMKNY